MVIRVGIVGAGNIASSRHIPAYENHERAKVVNIYDHRTERAERVGQHHDLSVEYDLSSLFEDVDLVSICTPPWVHAEQTIKALNQGCHVLTEKPMAMSKEEGERMKQAANDNDRLLSVVHNFLFMRSIRTVREAVASESAGDVNRTFAVQLKRFTNEDRHNQEWFDKLPGGLFWDESPHMLYLTRAFLGDMNLTSANVQSRDGPKQPFKSVRARFDGENGAEGTVLMAFDSPITEWWFVVVCDRAIFLVDVFRDVLLRFNEESNHSALRVLRVLLSGTAQLGLGGFISGLRLLRDRYIEGYRIPDSGFSIQVDGVLKSISEGSAPPVTASDGSAILDQMVEVVNHTQMQSTDDNPSV